MTTTPAPTPEPPLVLSLDIGTSSIRASVWDRAANPVAGLAAKMTYPLNVTDDGGVEANIRDIVESAAGAIDEVLAAAGPLAGQIAGVGMCSLAASVLGVGADGQPTTPVYTWADTRPAAQVADHAPQLGCGGPARAHRLRGPHQLPARPLPLAPGDAARRVPGHAAGGCPSANTWPSNSSACILARSPSPRGRGCLTGTG